jgi:hypothetical protein
MYHKPKFFLSGILMAVIVLSMLITTSAQAVTGSFTKISPTNGIADQSLSLTLSWEAYYPGYLPTFKYCLETDPNSICDTGWINAGLAVTSVDLTNLTPWTTYHWQVLANDDGTLANGGAWWTFTTGGAPQAFNKSSPANGATGQPLSLTLSWAASTGATSYAYCLGQSTTFCNSPLVTWTDVGSATSVNVSGLQQGTGYVWQVRATNRFGSTYAGGNKSNYWSFTTGSAPTAFGKSSPASGATNQPLSLTLSWVASSGATTYAYCIGEGIADLCKTSPIPWVNAGTATSANINVAKQGTTYSWQVRATNNIDTTYADGSSTAYWTFTTIPAQTTLYTTGAYDGWVLESSETSNKGGSLNAIGKTFHLGDDAFKRQYRAILSFDTSKLPAGAVIQSVTLRIKQSGKPVGSDPFKTMGTLLLDIKKGSFGKSALEITDFQAKSVKKVGTFAKESTGWYVAALNATGIANINRTGVTQFRLYFTKDDNNNAKAEYMKFFSGNNGTGKPELSIIYTVP